jgi:hypothetical protein
VIKAVYRHTRLYDVLGTAIPFKLLVLGINVLLLHQSPTKLFCGKNSLEPIKQKCKIGSFYLTKHRAITPGAS